MRKHLLNGHAIRMSDNRQPVTGTGGMGDDNRNRSVEMTSYRSTSLGDAHQPVAFAQRPQTYDEVILSSERLPFIDRSNTADQYNQVRN